MSKKNELALFKKLLKGVDKELKNILIDLYKIAYDKGYADGLSKLKKKEKTK